MSHNAENILVEYKVSHLPCKFAFKLHFHNHISLWISNPSYNGHCWQLCLWLVLLLWLWTFFHITLLFISPNQTLKLMKLWSFIFWQDFNFYMTLMPFPLLNVIALSMMGNEEKKKNLFSETRVPSFIKTLLHLTYFQDYENFETHGNMGFFLLMVLKSCTIKWLEDSNVRKMDKKFPLVNRNSLQLCLSKITLYMWPQLQIFHNDQVICKKIKNSKSLQQFNRHWNSTNFLTS